MPNIVFSGAKVRELAHDPVRFIMNAGRVEDDGEGFGYPQEPWLYNALEAYHGAGRNLAAADRYLDDVLAKNVGPTEWKVERVSEIRVQVRRYALRDQRRKWPHLATAQHWRPPQATWRGHALALRTGLMFEPSHRIVRLVWSAKKLAFARRGSTMVAAATLAQLEAAAVANVEFVEVFQLRDGDERLFPVGDLKSMWTALDRLLTQAERRPEAPPAA